MIPEGMFHLDLSSIGAEPLDDEDPRRIGAFPIKAVLGSGGMGRVYLGIAPQGYTAVKRVLPYLSNDQTFLRHFGQELDNQARLPAGVSARLLAADRTARPPWFATEYIPGVTLHDSVYLNGGSLPIETSWLLLRELAERLKAIAALEMVHRDLKPSNVMLTGSGVTLIDFGIARAADQSALTATGLIVGTPAYMAPEQARAAKSLTPAADVFCLGGLITFAATGEPPFGAGGGADQLFRIVHEPPNLERLRAADTELAGVVESCLAKNPAERPLPAELAEIAARHAVPGRARWPTPVAERIAIRAEFAAGTLAAGPEDDGATEFEPPEQEANSARTPGAGRSEPEVELAAGPDAEAETVPVISPRPGAVPDRSAKRKVRDRGRRRMTLIVPVVLVGGTAGTLIAMNKVPFTTPQANLNPTISVSNTHATAKASASASPRTSATKSASARPSSSGSVSPSAGSGVGGSSTAAGSAGNGGGATTTTTTTRAASTHTTSSGGGSGSDATVVSTTYSEVENVGASVCVSGSSGAGTQSCDGSSNAAFREVSVSGGFELVNQNTGLCLYNDYSTSGTAYAFSCNVLDPSTVTWTVGTRTSKGGELVNNGKCLAYSSSVSGGLTLAACNSSDSDQLWYDGGAA